MMSTRDKKPHGSGSIRWRGNAWRVQVYAGRREDGRPQYEYRTVRAPNTAKGRRKAEGVARELYDSIQRRTGDPGTVSDLLYRYIEHRSDDWAAQLSRNQGMLENHVIPVVGKIDAERLTTEDLDTCYRKMRRAGLSPSYVKRVHGMVHAAFEQALRWRMLDYNPAHAVTLTRIAPPAPTQLPKAATLRSAIAQSPPWFAVYLRLALHTGARTGELVGLKWEDIDLEDGVIRLWQGKTQKWKVLALGDYTAAVLTAWHWAAQRIYESWAGAPMPTNWWVFTLQRQPSRPMTAGAVKRHWERLNSAGAFGPMTLKTLRKTMSTVLDQKGFSLRTIMGRGGWSAAAATSESGASVLLLHYAQFVREEDRRAAEAMDEWLDG